MSLLQALLADGARFDAEYRGGLSNHLPMALLALHRLGAGDERLRAFATRYAQRLAPAPMAGETPPPSARLGHRADWPALRLEFAASITRDGASETLRHTLPRLMPGCGAAAFHGLIRTAYAWQAGHAGELADGLAYWACRWLPLDGTVPAANDGLLFEQMQRAAAAPGFAAEVAAVQQDAGTLQHLARQSAQFYAGSGNFTVLHLVTSCHALRTLLPCLDDKRAAVGHYVVAHVAARLASAAVVGPEVAPLPWADLVHAALTSDDDHLVKLVDSCREETALYGGDDWQRAASRIVVTAARSAGR